MEQPQPEGNYYDKYNTKNPIAKKLMDGFFSGLEQLLAKVEFDNLYEAGCGEGHLAEHIRGLYPLLSIRASDVSQKVITEAKERCDDIDFHVSSIYSLPAEDNAFDLVMAMEVLEHLQDPEEGLKEVLRLSRRHVLISVPNEPIWRISNMARGKYLKAWGNTPGHVQHWSKRGFMQFAEQYCDVVEYRSPFPWTMLLCSKRGQ